MKRKKNTSIRLDDYYSIKDLRNMKIFRPNFITRQEERVVKMRIPSWLLMYDHFWHDGGEFKGSTIIPLVEDENVIYQFYSGKDIYTDVIENNVSIRKKVNDKDDKNHIWATLKYDKKKRSWLIRKNNYSHQNFIIHNGELIVDSNKEIKLNNESDFIIGGTKFHLVKLHEIGLFYNISNNNDKSEALIGSNIILLENEFAKIGCGLDENNKNIINLDFFKFEDQKLEFFEFGLNENKDKESYFIKNSGMYKIILNDGNERTIKKNEKFNLILGNSFTVIKIEMNNDVFDIEFTLDVMV